MRFLRAFTLIELIIVLGVVSTLLAFSAANYLAPQYSSSLETTTTTLVSDLRRQQLLAMTGSSGGGEYGIYFDSGSYFLFPGSGYSPGDPANFQVTLNPGLTVGVGGGLPNPLIFLSGSGQIASGGTLTLSQEGSGVSRIFTLNTYGSVIQVQ